MPETEMFHLRLDAPADQLRGDLVKLGVADEGHFFDFPVMVAHEPEMGPQALGVFITRKFFRADHESVQRAVGIDVGAGVAGNGREILHRQGSQRFYDQDPCVVVHFVLNHG